MTSAPPQTKGLARHAGFTLIEVMVAVGIVAILAAIAYPSYQDYVTRGKLVDATNGLSAMQANMERYFQDNRTYQATGAATPPCSTATTVGDFTIVCPAATLQATTYVLSATGISFAFTIDQSSVRATTSAPTGWHTCASKWLLKKSDTCS